MTIYTLYVKIHTKTRLRYLGQTSKDPITYSGSGIDWRHHLREHGNNVETIILAQSSDKQTINNLGRHYSLVWNVVNGMDDFGYKIWANRIPETGGGSGERLKGIPRSLETRERIKKAMPDQSGEKNSFYGKKHSDEAKRRSGNANRGKNIKTKEGTESISKSMKKIWQDPIEREKRLSYLKARKGEKRSPEAIESYRKAAIERNRKISPEERSARAKAGWETIKQKHKGQKRKSYIDENGNKKFRYVSSTD